MNQRVVFLFSINLFLSRYAEEDVSGFNFIECLCLKMKIYIVPSVNKKKNLLKVFILDLKQQYTKLSGNNQEHHFRTSSK